MLIYSYLTYAGFPPFNINRPIADCELLSSFSRFAIGLTSLSSTASSMSLGIVLFTLVKLLYGAFLSIGLTISDSSKAEQQILKILPG